MLRALQRTVRPAVLGTARYATAAHPCQCALRLAAASRTPVDLCFRPPLRRYAQPALKDAEASVEEEELELQQEEAEELATPSSVILRPYQTEAIDACLAALQAGKRRIGVSSPTGSGKTTMFMHLIPHIPWNSATSDSEGDRGLGVDREFHEEAATAQHRNKGQVLILVGSVELAAQAEAAARRILGSDYTVEVEQSRRVATGYADITVATYQTLNNATRLAKFNPANFKLIIVDEAHHAAALSYMRLLHYFNDQVKLPQATGPITTFDHGHQVPIIGFSATFSRHDALALSAVFEEIVFHRDVGYMLQQGWLAPVKATSVYADLHLEQVEVTALGDYKTEALAQHVNSYSVNQLVVRTYLHRASEKRATLIFAVNLAHVDALVRAFRAAGVDARSVSSISKAKDRRQTIAAFQAGEFPVLINCEVLTEGTDIPEIDCVILARPTKSKNLLAQMVGRGLRLSPDTGKDHCYVIDIADNISRASNLMVSPTLFGLSHDDLPKEPERVTNPQGLGATPRGGQPSVKEVTLVDTSDPFGLQSEQKVVLNQVTRNAWVACGGNRYVLDLIGVGYMTVQPVDTKWSVAFVMKLPHEMATRSPYARPQQVAYADSLDRALETADKFAEKRVGMELYKKVSRYAEWRSRPASPRQRAMLFKRLGLGDTKVDEVSLLGKVVKVSELTSGVVAAYMTAAAHGAKGARAKIEKAALKEARRLEKLQAKAARNLSLPK